MVEHAARSEGHARRVRAAAVAAVCGAGALILASCTDLVSERIENFAKPLSPTSYFLKKRQFLIAATVELTGCRGVGAVSPGRYRDLEFKIEISAKVVPRITADDEYRFNIPQRKLKSPVKTTSFTIEFYSDRTIKSINSTLTDQTGEIVAKVLETASSVAGAFFFGRPSGVGPRGFSAAETASFFPTTRQKSYSCGEILKPGLWQQSAKVARIKKRIEALDAEIAIQESEIAGYTKALEAASPNHALYIVRRTAVLRRLNRNRRILGGLKKALAVLGKPLKHRLTGLFEPKWVTAADLENTLKKLGQKPPAPDRGACILGTCYSREIDGARLVVGVEVGIDSDKIRQLWFKSPTQAFPPDLGKQLGSVKLSARLLFDEWDRTGRLTRLMRMAQYPIRRGRIDGIVFRYPLPAKLVVTGENVTSTEILDDEGKKTDRPVFMIPQAGPIMLVQLHNGPFESNNIAVNFDANGVLTKFDFGSNGQLVTLAGVAAKTASQVTDILKSRSTTEVERLKVEKERLQLKKDIRDLQNQGIR